MTSWDLMIVFGPLLIYVTVLGLLFLGWHMLENRPDL